jgi:hypothetical protein
MKQFIGKLWRMISSKLFWIIFAVLILLSPLWYYAGFRAYRYLDPMTFPHESGLVKNLKPTLSDKEKGAALARAVTIRLKYELDSRFGWSVNDLYISPTRYFERRNSRQMGVIYATRVMAEFFSTDLAKYGQADTENRDLMKARNQCFSYSEDKWWMASTENRYQEGIDLFEKYAADLIAGRAIYNMRTDDIYNLLVLLTSSKCLDQPLGQLVQTSDGVPFSVIDDQIYFAQGVVLVVREFLHAMVNMYPEIVQKGGKQNIEIAFQDMDKVCMFDPVIVLRGERDSLFADHRGKMARYIVNMVARIRDLAQSINR